jgi:hypothetical protein
LRTSTVRTSTAPVTRVYHPHPVTTYGAPLRSSVVRTSEAPLRTSIVRTSEAPLRTSIVRTSEAPVTRVYTSGALRNSSYLGAPLRTSYVRGGSTLRSSAYVVGGHYPARTSVIRTSAYRPSTTYYPASSRVIPASTITTS